MLRYIICYVVLCLSYVIEHVMFLLRYITCYFMLRYITCYVYVMLYNMLSYVLQLVMLCYKTCYVT